MDPEAARPRPESRRTLILALSVYFAAVLLAGFQAEWNLVDDALILCRYGENVAAGHGPVYNPEERVEAHSSPLWVALLSLGGRAGMDLPYLSRALGVLSGAGVVVAASAAFPALFPPALALPLTLIVAGDAGPAVWGVSGLETNGFTLILFVTWILLFAALRNPGSRLGWLVGGFSGALALARPEGVILGALAVVTLLLGRRENDGARPGSVAAALLPFGLVVAGLFLWRVTWYGAWLPSSVTGKLLPRAGALTNGAIEIGGYLFRRWPLILCAVPAVLAARRAGRRDPIALWSFSALAASGVLVLLVIAAGGDWMGRDRLPGPMLPLVIMTAGFVLIGRSGRSGPRPSLMFLLAAAVISFSWWHPDRIPLNERVAHRLGEWLRKSKPAETRLGVAAAGAVPFYSGFRTIDALGISNREIAGREPPANAAWKPGHMRYDTLKFLAERPDIIVWEFGSRWCLARLAEPTRDPERRSGDFRRELLWSPEFRSAYRIMSGPPADTETMYTVFERTPDDRGPDPR